MDKRRFLKVKIKSLAEEARIIRLEETRSAGALRDELHAHRVRDVREEQRATLLAYAYIRGRTRARTERSDRPPAFSRVRSMVRKYGKLSATWEEDLDAWLAARPADGAGLSIPGTAGSTPVARSTSQTIAA